MYTNKKDIKIVKESVIKEVLTYNGYEYINILKNTIKRQQKLNNDNNLYMLKINNNDLSLFKLSYVYYKVDNNNKVSVEKKYNYNKYVGGYYFIVTILTYDNIFTFIVGTYNNVNNLLYQAKYQDKKGFKDYKKILSYKEKDLLKQLKNHKGARYESFSDYGDLNELEAKKHQEALSIGNTDYSDYDIYKTTL